MTEPAASSSGLVAMTSGGPHAWIMINALREKFGDVPVILEEGESEAAFWSRRKRMLGSLTVASMQAARVPIRLTKRGTEKRIAELIAAHGLQPEMPPGLNPIRVSSVNSPGARGALQSLKPKAVFVVSTRMIGKDTLSSVKAPFINYHSGINPAYRGMYGGYFALANGEPQHFGGTVHLVDEGVDTGRVLYQSKAEVSKADNFHTYLWVLAAASRDIVIKAMDDALKGALHPYTVDLPSKQYFAPTLGGYVLTGLTKGVW
jgi:methionyl-tRNA formyltransferase